MDRQTRERVSLWQHVQVGVDYVYITNNREYAAINGHSEKWL